MERKVSLCMIVKNEEKNLSRCIESVKDIVDEMIIVDTGSTDRTVEIAEGFGANVIHHKWNNDFSEARNISLKHAAGYWIMLMDADDELWSGDKERLKELIENGEGEAYYFETHSYVGDSPGPNITINMNLRLLKNHAGYYFYSPIHEQLGNKRFSAPGQPMPGELCDIKVYHYGYLTDTIAEKNKRERNTQLIKKQISEEPSNPFHYFNLGSEYFADNDYKSALDAYKVAYRNFDPYTGYSSKMLVRMVLCNIYLGEYEEALNFALEGLRLYPLLTDFEYLKGMVYNRQGKFTLAIRSYEKCIEMGEPPSDMRFVEGSGTYRPMGGLGDIYLQLKDYDMAYNCYLKSLQMKPNNTAPLYCISHILKEQKVPVEEYKKKMESFFGNLPEQYPIIADLFFMEDLYDTALYYLAKFEASVDSMPQHLIFFKCKCLVNMTKYDECIKQVNRLKPVDGYYFEASMLKILCLIITERVDAANETIKKFRMDIEKLSPSNKTKLDVYERIINVLTVMNKNENPDYRLNPAEIGVFYEIISVLLTCREKYLSEVLLEMLRKSENSTISINLGKLYYKYGYKNEAVSELIKSIKMHDLMDKETFRILEEAY